jgi:SpoVK/Ycf46/Vps4 family AAA+-type ATPase
MNDNGIDNRNSRKAFSGLACMVHHVKSTVSWEDLTFFQGLVTKLMDICKQVKVTNMESNSEYSSRKSLPVLLIGSSGASKIVAAEVISNELNLDLYRIDLSAVVSRYVAETEKCLDRIFSAAEQCDVILYFDESDALFGNQTDARNTNRRYANFKTSYLLQKMEITRALPFSQPISVTTSTETSNADSSA